VYKVKFNDFTEWYLQGMIYAWLLTNNNFPVRPCRFIAILKDHSKTEAARDYQYPKQPVYVYEFPVTRMGLFKIGMLIRDKVNEYLKYHEKANDEIPPCLPGERWERPAKFAVMKTGTKRAVRLFDDKRSAEQKVAEFGVGYFIEHRPGECIKCQGYCLCNRFCHYYRTAVNPSLSTMFGGEREKQRPSRDRFANSQSTNL
jgi:hypothetical protein